MNRREFLQATIIVPTSIATIYFAEKVGAFKKCRNCLPLKIYRQTKPTNTEVVSFSAKRNTFVDYIRELWQKFFEQTY